MNGAAVIKPDAVAVPVAAARLGVPVKTAWHWIYTGTLPSVRVGGRRLVLVAELDRLLMPQAATA